MSATRSRTREVARGRPATEYDPRSHRVDDGGYQHVPSVRGHHDGVCGLLTWLADAVARPSTERVYGAEEVIQRAEGEGADTVT